MYLWILLGFLATVTVVLIFTHDSGAVGNFSSAEFAQIASLSAITLFLATFLVNSYHRKAGKALKDASIWVAIAVSLIAAYSLKDEATAMGHRVLAELVPGYAIEGKNGDFQTVSLKRRSDGHFAARVLVNGVTVPMLVDTGASTITLSADDAAATGFNIGEYDYTVPISTANGRSTAAPIKLNSVSIGGLEKKNVEAMVARPGALRESLLGISFLRKLDSYEVRGDTLQLRDRQFGY